MTFIFLALLKASVIFIISGKSTQADICNIKNVDLLLKFRSYCCFFPYSHMLSLSHILIHLLLCWLMAISMVVNSCCFIDKVTMRSLKVIASDLGDWYALLLLHWILKNDKNKFLESLHYQKLSFCDIIYNTILMGNYCNLLHKEH